MTKQTDFSICGRAIGTASGWDQAENLAMILYDFQPSPSASAAGLVAGSLMVDFENGFLQYHTEDGTLSKEFDLIDTLVKVEKAP